MKKRGEKMSNVSVDQLNIEISATSKNASREIDNLCNECDLICLKRNVNSVVTPYPMTSLDNRIINISSTDIRNRIRNGRKVDFLLPDKVKDYINTHKLYI